MWSKRGGGQMMHPKVKKALEEIDAAVFNGDDFDDDESRAEFNFYLARWQRAVARKDSTNRAGTKE
jgi:hypothetical protein